MTTPTDPVAFVAKLAGLIAQADDNQLTLIEVTLRSRGDDGGAELIQMFLDYTPDERRQIAALAAQDAGA